MSHPGVLVDFTEQVLAVDQLQPAAVDAREAQAQPSELFGLCVAHVANELCFGSSSSVAEAFADSVPRAGSSDNEVHLVKVDQGRVVDVDDQLVREGVAETRMAAEQLERVDHRCCRTERVGQPAAHQPLQQQEVVGVFTERTQSRRRNDIGRGVDPLTGSTGPGQDLVVPDQLKFCPAQFTKR